MDSEDRSLIDLLKEAADLDGRVSRHPYGMVAGALGAGFVLGGGLFTRLTERLAGAAVRIGVMAAWPVLRDEIFRRAGQAVGETDSQERKGESS